METIKQIFNTVIARVMENKKIVFVYIPVILLLLFSSYIAVIFFQWQSDREAILKKLTKYKQLIDRTEELRKGYIYKYKDVDLAAKAVDVPTRIYDRNEEVIGEFFEQKREIVPYDHIPQWLVKAVMASEDRDFYIHSGLSFKGILRALIVNIIHFRVEQGGSTITQQLAKVLFTDMERSLKRKVYEAFCAREIEKRYDKQDIISMYLNLIYFGNGAYGVESASKMLFGLSVKNCSEVECVMIVAAISNPKLYSAILNLDNSVRKTRRILQSMVDSGYMDKALVDRRYRQFVSKWNIVFDSSGKAKSSLIGSFLYSSYRINRAPFFNEMIRRVLTDRFGEEVVKRGGLKVYTTIDAEMQDIAEKQLHDGIMSQRKYHLVSAGKTRDNNKAASEMEKAENIEGALIAINPRSGEIMAYVGGSEFSTKNQNDHVSQIRRQPGSSFKPIIYAAAIESKEINPSTIIEDEKHKFKGGYKPANYDGVYRGPVTVREAVCKSINVVAVKVLEKIGYSGVMDIIGKSLDLASADLKDRFYKTLSLALGAYEVSPLENCVLHSVIVNGGDYVQPYGIKQVKDYNDNIVWNNEETVTAVIEDKRRDIGKIIDPVAAAIMVSMLRGVFEEGGTAEYSVKGKKIGYQIAGKTGTSSNYYDAWFVGYISNLVTTVWIGNKSGSISLGSGRAGGAVAAPIWSSFISKAYSAKKPDDFSVPDQGISRETICVESGEVAGRNGECPKTAVQLYYSGSEPGAFCHIHASEKKDETQTEDEKHDEKDSDDKK